MIWPSSQNFQPGVLVAVAYKNAASVPALGVVSGPGDWSSREEPRLFTVNYRGRRTERWAAESNGCISRRFPQALHGSRNIRSRCTFTKVQISAYSSNFSGPSEEADLEAQVEISEEIPTDDSVLLEENFISEQLDIATVLDTWTTQVRPEVANEPLLYQIPANTLEKALVTGTTKRPEYWSYSMYEHITTGQPPELHYCKNLEESEACAKKFLQDTLVGFDLEWAIQGRKTIKRNVSVIQLASETRIAIFHIALHAGETVEELLAPTLKKILESTSITKAGVNIKSDCTRLLNNFGVKSRSLFELSHLHQLVTLWEHSPSSINRSAVALKELVEQHLLLPMHKGDVRTSAWDTRLTNEQLSYAASDAYASVQLFHLLNQKRLGLSETPPPMPRYAEFGMPIELGVKDKYRKPRSLPLESEYGTVDGATESERTELRDESLETIVGITKIRSGKQRSSPSLGPEPNAKLASQLVSVANDWVTSLMASPQSANPPAPTVRKIRSTASQLRAYFLWQHHSLSVGRVAALLRDPPLKVTTVATYIVQAVHQDNLPFDEDRMRDACKKATFLPPYLRSSSIVGKYLRNT